MEPDASTASLDLMRNDSDDDCQSSAKMETYDGNKDDDNAVHSSESKETELEPNGPQISHTHSSCKSDSSYTVTCTVSMALAVPRGYKDDPVTAAEKGMKKLNKVLSNRIVEAPKPQAYYHIEYNLLPDDSEPTKVDLVMFGLAAKVYMENETKVLKPWQEGDHLWLGWSHPVKLNVTRELLVKMPSHKITFRLWDTKDKVSAKARYDRPKAFRLPQGRSMEDPDQTGGILDCEPDSSGGIKSMVYKLRAVYEKENPTTRTSMKSQRDVISMDYKRPSEFNCAIADPELSTMEAIGANEKFLSSVALNAAGGLLAQEVAQLSNQRYPSYGGEQNPETADPKSNKPEGPADQEKDLAVSKLAQKRSLDRCAKGLKNTTSIPPMKSSSLKDKSLVVSKMKPAHKTVYENTAETEDIRKNGIAMVELNAMCLLAGETSLTDSLMFRCGRGSEGLCSITLDQPLMSEELKAEFNPLTITILSAFSLPSSPVPFYELQQKCMSVYCQYKFHDMPAHRTKGLHHGSNIRFKDVNVILTGLLSTEEVLEFLRGPPLEIEVHDRDKKAEEPPISPAIFGTEPNDDKLASTALVNTKHTTYNSFREKSKLCDPYGIAKLNLSDLLRGHRCLKLSLPIRGSHPGKWLGSEKNERGNNKPETAGPLDGSQDSSMPIGHYLKANSKLKVQVEIAYPLDPHHDKSEGRCPFGRIIYIFKYNNVHVLNKLRSEILRINAVAFQLDSYNEETAQRILHGHIMNAIERESKNLDALTGFHILDQSVHLFVLEGLKEKAIKKLWETVPIKLDEDVEKQVTVLYNSGLSFSKRLYDTLEVGLSTIHLHEPLETIMRQPLVYVRDTVSYTCLQAMLRINHLCQVRKLEEVVQNNLFPLAIMVHSLSKEFRIIPNRGVERLMPDTRDTTDILDHHASRRRTYTPIDNFNKDYLAWKQCQTNQELHTKNFVQANIEDIHKASSVLQKLKPKVVVAKVDDCQSAHNYSIQTMNCTTLAKELLHKEMAKEPARRFTYSQHYHSFTVDPVDIEAERKGSEARFRAWRNWNGFIYPGFKDSIESNQHPNRPDEARVKELRKPWRENVLHENILGPVLNRTTWPWSKRHEDFELYRKPPAVLSPLPPITIHLAGEALHQEKLQAAQAQYAKWLTKLLPDKDSTSSSRVPEFTCHMRRAGLDKLHDLLKDKPMKHSLRAWRASMPMPYTNTYITQRAERENHSQTLDTHTNARHTGQHSKSQFGCYWRPHSFQHKQAALPLTDEEKSLHVFQKPQNTTKIYTDLANTQYKQNVIEMRTYNRVTVHMK